MANYYFFIVYYVAAWSAMIRFLNVCETELSCLCRLHAEQTLAVVP